MNRSHLESQVQTVLEQIKVSHQHILGGNLVGIYVHGSLAFGCFRWETSDIDFLVVVREPPSLYEKEKLVEALLQTDRFAPRKGLEMSVMLEKHCRNFLYPTPFELHFSNMHKQKARENRTQYCQRMKGVDKDLAAHITVLHETGIVLCGSGIDAVFSPIPKADYLDSLRADCKDAVSRTDEDPVYCVLNLCRILAFIRDDRVLSKEQGGKWGIQHLPVRYKPLIRKLVNRYSGVEEVWTDADRTEARDFATYSISEIFAESG